LNIFFLTFPLLNFDAEAILVLCREGDVDGMKSFISKFGAKAVVGAKTEIEMQYGRWGKVTGGGTTGLHAVAEAEKTQVVSFLLKNGADPDAEDGLHQLPLAFAIKKGHVDAVRLLMEQVNVDMNMHWGRRNEKSWT
jgi:hypothetical protein